MLLMRSWRTRPSVAYTSVQQRWKSAATILKKGDFSEAEDNRILALQNEGKPVHLIALDLERSRRSVDYRLHNVLLKDVSKFRTSKNGLYSQDEDNRILEMKRNGSKLSAIALELGRTATSIKSRIRVMPALNQPRYGSRVPYSQAEKDRVAELRFEKRPLKFIAAQLGRTLSSVSHRVYGVHAASSAKEAYTKEEYNYITHEYQLGKSIRVIAKGLERSEVSIYLRLHRTLLSGGPRPISRRQSHDKGGRQFSLADLEQMAALKSTGHTDAAIAKIFGMPRGTFPSVWQRVRTQPNPLVLRDPSKRNSTPADRLKILNMRYEQHMSNVEIACSSGSSLDTVKRVMRSELNPQRKVSQPRLPWSEKEDAKLIHLHEQLGLSFAECAARIEGRSERGVRGRGTASTRALPWTGEEEAKMRTLRDQDGLSFSVIAERMVGRTAEGIRNRYNLSNVTPRLGFKKGPKAEATDLAVASTMTS
ncbi:hypothetical protein LTR56_017552 [Elasticomyces elasticus]|nr:hypothetical protein LTR56_017552 [Elasticomyces elasticus]KAK4913898.1 hypothetical protein LTR49_017824 [Elasticomyces elasticus]KAK5766359.1 hypothetical protein LTS12_003571 [Elasticomyces elasticus]